MLKIKETCILKDDIYRLKECSEKTLKLSLSDYDGYNKFSKEKFVFQKNHIAPPEQVYFLGKNWKILNAPIAVGFGGTVSPTNDGFKMAILLAQQTIKNEMKQKAFIVSGGVIGIDTASHLGALDEGGATIAVVANPVSYGLHPYVPTRSFLTNGILTNGGGIVSEYPQKDYQENYYGDRLLQRDRIITALSDIFIAIECSENSGTVDTAKRAKLQGKTVYTINWNNISKKWHIPKTSGCEQLISQNIAIPFPFEKVSGIDDIKLIEQFQFLLNSFYKDLSKSKES